MKELLCVLLLLLILSCSHRELYRYDNGKKKMLFISNDEGVITRSKTWYESGKIQSRSTIIKLDTFIVFDSLTLDSIAFVDIKQNGKEWYESGKLKKEFSVQPDGTRKIIYWSEEGVKTKEEVFAANRLIKVITY